MRIIRSICAVLLLTTPLGGCVELALLGLNVLSNGSSAPAMKQTGAMAEPVGQQTIQQALGLIDTGTLAMCQARNPTRNEAPAAPAEGRDTTTVATAAEVSPLPARNGRCELRPVCLPGFDQPVQMQVCERVDSVASAQEAEPGPNYWSWEGARLGDFVE